MILYVTFFLFYAQSNSLDDINVKIFFPDRAARERLDIRKNRKL